MVGVSKKQSTAHAPRNGLQAECGSHLFFPHAQSFSSPQHHHIIGLPKLYLDLSHSNHLCIPGS